MLPVPERVVAVLLLFLIIGIPLAKNMQAIRARPRKIGATISLLFTWVILSAFWRPTPIAGTLQPDLLWDIGTLIGLCGLAYLLASVDAAQALKAWFYLTWLTGLVFMIAGFLGQSDRAAAFGGGPNVYGRIVGAAAIACIVLVGRYRVSKYSLFTMPPLVLATVLSGSRGVLIALVGSGIILFLLARPKLRVRYVPQLTGLGLLTILLATLMVPRVKDVFQTRIIELTFQKTYTSGRTSLYRDAWEMFRENPVVGRGLGSFEVLFGHLSLATYPHNFFLQYAAETGVISIILIVVIGWQFVIVSVLRATDLGIFGGVALAGFMFLASQFSGDYFDQRILWLVILLTTGTAMQSGLSTTLGDEARPTCENEATGA